MKRLRLTIPALLFTLVLSSATWSKEERPVYPEVVIQGTQERLLKSSIVDQEYKLWISLPKNYEPSKQEYPVIYVLDAQWDFTMLISLYGQLNYDGDVPDSILVGVTWGGKSADAEKLRGRDFTPTKLADWENSGGADKFLEFWRKELIPFIAEEYAANDERVLIGSSLGGLFTTYAMLTQPDLFDGYLATATSAWWDNEMLISLVKQKARLLKVHSVKMYGAAGEFDGVLPGFKKLKSEFEAQSGDVRGIKFEIFDKLGHSGIKAIGNTRGLQYLFAKDVIQLSKQQRQALIGSYANEQSMNVKVFEREENIWITTPQGEEVQFNASSATTFHQVGANVNVEFDLEAQPVQIKAKTPDGMLVFKRVE